MKQDLQSRIQRMFAQDCIMAWVDVALLWSTVLFVLYFILQIVEDPNVRLAMYISSFALLIFNTASVSAMTKHFVDDKQFIYGLDIKHVDANRAAKAARK
jgi:hypothetical protein